MILIEAWELSEQALHWLLIGARHGLLYTLTAAFLTLRVLAIVLALRLMRGAWRGLTKARAERRARKEAVSSKPWGSLIDLHPTRVKTQSDTMPD